MKVFTDIYICCVTSVSFKKLIIIAAVILYLQVAQVYIVVVCGL